MLHFPMEVFFFKFYGQSNTITGTSEGVFVLKDLTWSQTFHFV